MAELYNGNRHQALEYLEQALAIALPDRIYLPLAQQEKTFGSILESAKGFIADREGLNTLITLSKRQEKGVAIIKKAIFAQRSPLTPREREVAGLAKNRLSAKEIAQQLYISETTVRTVLKSIYNKLDIHSKNELHLKEF